MHRLLQNEISAESVASLSSWVKLSVSEFGALTPKTPEEVRLLEEPVRLANVLISQLAISIGWNLQEQTFNEGSSNTPGSEIHVESDDLMRLRYICIDRQATIRRKSSTIHLDVRYEIQIASISVFHGIWWRMKQINRGTEHHDLRFPNALGSSSASFLKSLVEKKRYQAIIRFLTSKCCNSSILGFWTSVKQIKIPRSCSWLLSLAASSSFSTDTREPMVSPYGLICRLWARKKEKISQRFLWS